MGDSVMMFLFAYQQLLGWVMRCFQHWYTSKHINTQNTVINTETHAQHVQIQCCGACRHSSHGLKERWAFRKRGGHGGVSKGAKILSENKKNILLGV